MKEINPTTIIDNIPANTELLKAAYINRQASPITIPINNLIAMLLKKFLII